MICREYDEKIQAWIRENRERMIDMWLEADLPGESSWHEGRSQQQGGDSGASRRSRRRSSKR